jgi:hypothetical protein
MMDKISSFFLPAATIIVFLFTMIPGGFAKDRIFKGKVIDAGTQEPIEGAVVVAHWYEATQTLIGDESTRLREIKETLTDRNGDWLIVGEEGEPHNPHPYLGRLYPIYYTRQPEFIIFKPGYCSWPKGFNIEACKERLNPGGNGKIRMGENVELPKVTKREDRLRALPSPIYASDDSKIEKEFLKKQVEFLGLINEECRNLDLSEFKIYKDLKHEN